MCRALAILSILALAACGASQAGGTVNGSPQVSAGSYYNPSSKSTDYAR